MYALIPHPDDEVLFTAYTIMRAKPTVVILTYPTLQGDNGLERIMESYTAVKLLGSPIMFLNIPEHAFTEERLRVELDRLDKSQAVHVPHLDGGHEHHDITHKVATDMFDNVSYYRTYGQGETRAKGFEVDATDAEKELKQKAMNCHKTQINNPLTAHYFKTLNEYE
jgi:LmbE family N-acetylglucosaminyl deacetylase